MVIKTSDEAAIRPFLAKFNFPKADSHKGQNGKVLIIGGSSLFHAASIWAAEIASYFVDMVHYSSTEENNQVFLTLKKKFRNGIIVAQKNVLDYVAEDDAILVGPGMLRGESKEARYAKDLVYRLLTKFPNKKFVFDAGALQNMEAQWLKRLEQPAIVTPQAKEFETLFGVSLTEKTREDKIKIVEEKAKEYKTVILLKTVFDVVSDGKQTFVIEGGNQGLTKGGTGDILAGLTVSFFAKNEPIVSAVLASYLLKKTAEVLSLRQGYWYNIGTIIEETPRIFFNLSK
jgi:hydroxyethylthiazole kinase-like uncharacterized protein yjeF